MASSYALAEYADEHGEGGALLPDLNDIRDVSIFIAKAVYRQAIKDGVAYPASEDRIAYKVNKNFWYPAYRNYRRAAV